MLRIVSRGISELITLATHWPKLWKMQSRLRRDSPTIDPWMWREAAGLLRKLGLGERSKRLFWLGCNGRSERLISKSEKHLLLNQPDKAHTLLVSSRHSPFGRESTASLQEAFQLLSGTTRSLLPSSEPHDHRLVLTGLVSVSGLNSSGASAVFDYLREWSNVIPIEREIPHLTRGKANLSVLRQEIDDPIRFRIVAIRFFLKYLLGFSRIDSELDFRIHRFGRERSVVPEKAAYFAALSEFARLVNVICRSSTQTSRRAYFQNLVDLVMCDLVVGKPIHPGQIILMRGAIKVAALPSIDLFARSTTLCVFRDPRSQFVALRTETNAFVDSVEEWVGRTASKLERAHNLVDSFTQRTSDNRVRHVQFEDFVLSDSYRRKVALFVGLGAGEHHNKEQHFRPKESARNVYLHKTYPEQSEIAYIASQMKDHCNS